MGLDFLLQPLFGIHFWPVKDRMCRPNKCSYKNNIKNVKLSKDMQRWV